MASKVADDVPPQQFIVEVLLPKTTDWNNQPFGEWLQLTLNDLDAPAPTKLARSWQQGVAEELASFRDWAAAFTLSDLAHQDKSSVATVPERRASYSAAVKSAFRLPLSSSPSPNRYATDGSSKTGSGGRTTTTAAVVVLFG